MRFLIPAMVGAMAIGATAGAQPAGRILACGLVDLASGRTVDFRQAEIPTGSPITLLFGYRNLNGTVRDLPGSKPGERNLFLTLFYSSGSENGNAQGGGPYEIDQPITSKPLAEVSLDAPDSMGFETSVNLRCFLQEGSHSSPTLNALADTQATTWENGFGTAYGMCSGSDGWFCMDGIKRQARQNAVLEAQRSCELEKGSADTLSPSCTETCNPFDLPPYAPMQNVSCSSNCSVRCDIQ